MKSIVTVVLILTFGLGFAQNKKEIPKTQIVEAACGQCQFGMTSKKGCDLAVRIGKKSYFVDGTKIDDHGDAHAVDGFCTTIRKAKVAGSIFKNRFIATTFILLENEQ